MRTVRRTAARGKTGRTEAARLFHALSDETRLAILERLRNGEECVCNLMDLLAAGQSRLSFHMKTLKDAGLVRDRREGRWIHYSLVPGAFEAVHDFAASYGNGDAPEAAACCKK
jgi:ArsR family transcriptional regulator, arsenate/arsenite/antimonite-responsive transcriptional repressor